MDPELYSMLNLYKSKNMALSMKDVALLLDSSDIGVSGPIINLFNSGYLRAVGGYIPEDGHLAVDTKLRLTYAGELAMRENDRSKKDRFWNSFRAWFTLAIALIGLIVAIISLIWQQPLHH